MAWIVKHYGVDLQPQVNPQLTRSLYQQASANRVKRDSNSLDSRDLQFAGRNGIIHVLGKHESDAVHAGSTEL